MTDEPADAGQERASPDRPESCEDITSNVHFLIKEGWGTPLDPDKSYLFRVTPEELLIATPVIIFAKAYLEALGRRAGEGTADLVKGIRFRRKRGTGETRLGIDSGAAATVVVTEDLPDEARLALLDLDVTAPELRGKVLRWDAATAVWRPSEALPAHHVGRAASHTKPSDP